MPADILGTNIVMETGGGRREFQFQRGPIFAHLVLADEINRATPKTQSALLEAMQEHSVTAGGEIRKLVEPFFVMATQNPIDQEGTYPLPEAQLDRFFFKILVGYPSAEELTEVLTRTTTGARAAVQRVLNREALLELMALVREVPVASHVKDYAVRLIMATHPRTDSASPIASQYLWLAKSAPWLKAVSTSASMTSKQWPRPLCATGSSLISKPKPKASRPTISLDRSSRTCRGMRRW